MTTNVPSTPTSTSSSTPGAQGGNGGGNTPPGVPPGNVPVAVQGQSQAQTTSSVAPQQPTAGGTTSFVPPPPVTHLGTVAFTSPIQRRYRAGRRSSLTAADIHAININNEVVGEEGQQFPLPVSLFGSPSISQQQQQPVQPTVQPPTSKAPKNVPYRTVTIDERPFDIEC